MSALEIGPLFLKIWMFSDLEFWFWDLLDGNFFLL